MKKAITYVGLDAHQETIHAAILLPGAARPLEESLANTPEAIRRFVRRLGRRAPGEVICAYEAGPLGYELMRQLEELGVGCVVVAPSLIPRKPGERIKTDRRDARKLAELLRAGRLTPVHAPTPEQEAVRDLCRAREAAKGDQKRLRHRLAKFLVRRGLRWTRGRKMWTQTHLDWLRGQRRVHPADQAILDDHLLALEQLEGRLAALDAQVEAWAQEAPWAEPVAWLRCFRGIDTLTALALVAEVHDWRRFPTPRALMAYLGLVPSEHSSGGSERRRGQPARVVAIADRAQQRLHARTQRLCPRQPAHIRVCLSM